MNSRIDQLASITRNQSANIRARGYHPVFHESASSATLRRRDPRANKEYIQRVLPLLISECRVESPERKRERERERFTVGNKIRRDERRPSRIPSKGYVSPYHMVIFLNGRSIRLSDPSYFSFPLCLSVSLSLSLSISRVCSRSATATAVFSLSLSLSLFSVIPPAFSVARSRF